MKNLAYRFQVLILVVWIPCVMALFKMIPEKRVAALFAGAGFILIPTLFILGELRRKANQGAISKLYLFICGEFLVLSALPIFLLRVLNWNSEFSELSLFGVSADFLHKSSNSNYMLLLVCAAYLAFVDWRNEKSQPKG